MCIYYYDYDYYYFKKKQSEIYVGGINVQTTILDGTIHKTGIQKTTKIKKKYCHRQFNHSEKRKASKKNIKIKLEFYYYYYS